MRVLLLGATGNLGSRLVLALLNHGHTVTAYVRNTAKLRTVLPEDITSQLTVVEGDAKNPATIQAAIVDHRCDAVVNAAGAAAPMPWQHTDLPAIVRAVVDAAANVQKTTGKRLRCWLIADNGSLDYPGKNGKRIVDYLPIFKEHSLNVRFVETVPTSTIAWSLLCPALIVPASKDKKPTTADSTTDLVVSATVLPGWTDYWVSYIPLIGNALNALWNGMRATTTFEACADFIATDLDAGSEEWVGKRVAPKARAKSA